MADADFEQDLMAMFAGTNLVPRFALTEQDTCYVSMPLFHSNAVVAGWAPAVCSGAASYSTKTGRSRRFMPCLTGIEPIRYCTGMADSGERICRR